MLGGGGGLVGVGGGGAGGGIYSNNMAIMAIFATSHHIDKYMYFDLKINVFSKTCV